MPYDWYSSDIDNKKIRRAAADSFLSDVLDNVDGIGDAVTGLDPAKKQKAKEELDRRLRKTAGGGPLPSKVEVICIEADTNNRANLVVFILHKKGAIIQGVRERVTADTWWKKRWVAAWAPYGT
jgi:hypothetical protein